MVKAAMEIRRPPCRNAEVHGPHGYWTSGYVSWNDCPGWSGREADITALADRLNVIGRDAAWPLSLPAGIRLECHAAVTAALEQMAVPSYAEFTAGLRSGEDFMKPQIPVVHTRGMAAGQWRIVADEGAIAEGVIAASPAISSR